MQGSAPFLAHHNCKSQQAKQLAKTIAAAAETASAAAAALEAAASEAASLLPPSATWVSQHNATAPSTNASAPSSHNMREQLVRFHQEVMLLQSQLNASELKLTATAESHTHLEILMQQLVRDNCVLDDALNVCVAWQQRCGAGLASDTTGMGGVALASDMVRQHQILSRVVRFINSSDPANTNASLQQQVSDQQSQHATTISKLEAKLSKTVLQLQTLQIKYDSEVADTAAPSQQSQPDSDYTPHTPAGPSTSTSLRTPLQLQMQPWLTPRGYYSPVMLQHYSDLIHEYDLKGRRISELFLDFLTLCTGLDKHELHKSYPLPVYSTLMTCLGATAVGKERQLAWLLSKGFISIEHDGGAYMRREWNVTLLACVIEGLGKRYFSGAPLVCSTKAEDTLKAVLDVLECVDVGIQRVLYDVTDSAASCVRMSALLDAHKQSEIDRMISEGELHPPGIDLVPADMAHLFAISLDQPTVLLSKRVYRISDLIHMLKNAEIAGLASLGAAVHPATGELHNDLTTSVLFAFARLHALSLNFMDVVHEFLPPGTVIPPIPGVIKHRLLIKTLLGYIIHTFRDPILRALWAHNEALGGGKWKNSSKQALLTHMHEVWLGLQHPLVRVGAAMLAKLHPIATAAYTDLQKDGGFILSKALPVIRKTTSALTDMLDNFQSVCAEEVKLAYEVCNSDSLAIVTSGEEQYVSKEGSTTASASGGGGRGGGRGGRGGGRVGQGRVEASINPTGQPMCQLLTDAAICVYAQTAHGRKRMIASDATADAAIAIADAEEQDRAFDSACGFDENGDRLVEDDSAACSHSVVPDQQTPSVERRAAVIRAAAALEAHAAAAPAAATPVAQAAATRAAAVTAPPAAAPAAATAAPSTLPCTPEWKYGSSIIEGWKRMITAMRTYIHQHTHFLTEYPFRAACFFHTDGSDIFAEDMHLSSDACGRTCPSGCRFCGTSSHPKWSREQHIQNTQHSFALFDRPSLQQELEDALATGVMGSKLRAFYTAHFAQASVSSMSVERKVGQLRKGVARCTSTISYGRLLLKIGDCKVPLSADSEEWQRWLVEADNRKELRRLVRQDPAGYVAQLAVYQQEFEDREEAAAAREQRRVEIEEGKAAVRKVKAAIKRAKDLVTGLRLKEFKVMALQALGLLTTGSVPVLTLRLLGANLSLLEDVCPRLHILALEKTDGTDLELQTAAALAATPLSESETQPRFTSPARPAAPLLDQLSSPSKPPAEKRSKPAQPHSRSKRP